MNKQTDKNQSNDVIADQTNLSAEHAGAVMLVNKFYAKPGMLDTFVEVQTGEYKRLQGKVDGWKGNRLIKHLDGDYVLNIAVFDSLEKYNRWRESSLFAEHLEIVKPFVAKSEPGIYEILYDAGRI